MTDQRSHVKTDQRLRVKNQLTNATLAFIMREDIKKVMRKRSTHRHLKENDIHRLRDVTRTCCVEGSF